MKWQLVLWKRVKEARELGSARPGDRPHQESRIREKLEGIEKQEQQSRQRELSGKRPRRGLCLTCLSDSKESSASGARRAKGRIIAENKETKNNGEAGQGCIRPGKNIAIQLSSQPSDLACHLFLKQTDISNEYSFQMSGHGSLGPFKTHLDASVIFFFYKS